MQVTIRRECGADWRAVEELTREAFWNLFVPGCDEHYLVHRMRGHADFLPELAFVAVLDGAIVGNIMFTRSRVVGDSGEELATLTFGPVSVLPGHQRKGIGSALIRHSVRVATESGHAAILIHGHPGNYCRHGFRSSKDLGIGDSQGKHPYSLLALELRQRVFAHRTWKFYPSDVFDLDAEAAREFDRGFPPREKEYRYTQEEFSIACRAYLD